MRQPPNRFQPINDVRAEVGGKDTNELDPRLLPEVLEMRKADWDKEGKLITLH